jgi:hypothetical protein
MIDYITGPDPNIRFNYIRLVVFFTLPVIVIILSYLFWLLKGCISRMNAQERVDKTISTIAIIWYIFYPSIVSYLAQSINCTSIEGTPRLYNDLEEVCYQGRHMSIIYGVSIPGLILWAFGMPFLGAYLLRRNLRALEEVKFNSDPKIHGSLEARHKLRLGFLT